VIEAGMGYKKILKRLISSGTTIMHTLSDKKPLSGDPHGNPVWDQDAFSALDQLQQLLPAEDSERRLIEEMNLTLEAHTVARRLFKLSRLPREDGHPSPVSQTAPRQDSSRLTSSIDPQALKQQLFQKIEAEQLYLYEDLTLAGLAHELQIEPYQLTRFLNHHLHTTFHDLINAYRIKAAQERLKIAPFETILDIAFAVGFNSKASFNRVFKKTTGTTPSQYRKINNRAPYTSEPVLKQFSR
jgi:AraC-like DNA-binding protein